MTQAEKMLLNTDGDILFVSIEQAIEFGRKIAELSFNAGVHYTNDQFMPYEITPADKETFIIGLFNKQQD
jgi:hypothetical protein